MNRFLRSKLAEYFLRNGYCRVPNRERRDRERSDYRKGYEVRLVARNRIELLKIRDLLRRSDFNLNKPFRKGRSFVQPLYGRSAFRVFRSIEAGTR